VVHARPAHQAGGKNVVLVALLGLLDAIGGHDDGAGKLGELPGLVLPGRAVVAVEMGVFFQAGIAVGGQHFTMGVYKDPLALGLLQDQLQVLQVMAGHQQGLAFFVAQGNGRWHRVAVNPRIAGIQQLHGPQIDLAALEASPTRSLTPSPSSRVAAMPS
jgi:hypothetical protein